MRKKVELFERKKITAEKQPAQRLLIFGGLVLFFPGHGLRPRNDPSNVGIYVSLVRLFALMLPLHALLSFGLAFLLAFSFFLPFDI